MPFVETWIEAMVHDLREWLRLLAERNPRPTAAIFGGRTMQSSPESGARAGDDGYKRKKGGLLELAKLWSFMEKKTQEC